MTNALKRQWVTLALVAVFGGVLIAMAFEKKCRYEGVGAECHHECVVAVARSGQHPGSETARAALEMCRGSCPGARRVCEGP